MPAVARLAGGVVCGALVVTAATDARAFPHVVRKGETLAQIAERAYGRVELEQLLVAANGLDAGGGLAITPGMRLEVPAVAYRRVGEGETWGKLALEHLGDATRGDQLAIANHAMPWIQPADGQEILIPYNLRVVAGAGDSLLTFAYRYLGDRDQAWMLDGYNHRHGQSLKRGDVVLVPLHDLKLTPAGQAEAAAAGALVRAEGAGRARDAQRRADAELPQLAADIRAGRWVEAVGRGNRMIGYGELSRPELAVIQRALLEAYVALDAGGLAEAACAAWRGADPSAQLDEIELSPKIIRACVSGVVGAGNTNASSAAPPASSNATDAAPAASVRDGGPAPARSLLPAPGARGRAGGGP